MTNNAKEVVHMKNPEYQLKVAIVHEWLTNMGGSEQVVGVLLELFPDAPVYTSLYESANLEPSLAEADVRPSFLQRLPKFMRKHQNLLPLMPYAFEQFDLSDYDLVLSSSSSCAKGVITGTKTIHVCYCYTPMRYAWDSYHFYMKSLKCLKRWLAVWLMHRIRMWDRLSADRVDHFIAISHAVQERIRKHYRRESRVVYPPVDIDRFTSTCVREEFYVVVSRLVGYKRVDLAIEACNRLGRNLVVIGDGEEQKRLKAMDRSKGEMIKFLGRQSDLVVADYLARARAFLFPGEEDFGLTMVEALASGCPVITYGQGGAVDIVEDGVTGVLFKEQTAEGMMAGILRFEELSGKGQGDFEPSLLRSKAGEFSKENFKKSLLNVLVELGVLSNPVPD
ncbi:MULTISPECIES: glycosyltransferase [Desulfosporosinus]|uniref:Glycosyltransferase involved in cell wall bisynthesis n=1 Tax=Desulfosporosinus lacus DSM 15449 TaxID=1121420 RepID=A0A1M5RYM5_9FIRM|nr:MULTISPECIES: glycosyltransferase [Desulfosporosinus]MDA8221039.1 glycosyltransferase [Desulfitobacterium hafniense]SHH31346.1 Glycosyltransferase involved in cell wall bisynthesis [Desulfosporosinus lacus DSM 15449]